MRKIVPATIAALAALGAVFWWRRWPQNQEMLEAAQALPPDPSEAAVARPRREVPPPDSEQSGRTPRYFVPGEALVVVQAPQPLPAETLEALARRFGGRAAPLGTGRLAFPAPEAAEWVTVLRLHWTDAESFEATLERFAALEKQVRQEIAEADWRVTSWMPNWLGSVASDAPEAERHYTPGGPGAYPRPVAAPGAGLALTDAPFLEQWREGMAQPITLAILDAFPTAERLNGRALPGSLGPLADALRQDETPLAFDAERHFAAFRTGQPFDMSDHGLMTTWLATEVIGAAAMERVTLEPVRVAAASGVCSVADVLAGLAPLVPRAIAGERFVVLLAFVVGMGDIIPPRLRPYEEHYEALRLACLALSEAGATLIGAAGNDGTGLQHPPRTRIPAAFRSVIEVTAGQLAQPGLALYANQAKALCLFGGESDLNFIAAENLPALLGPAVTPELRTRPDTLVPNETGWMAWAGTSFAAALAAGLTVLLRSREPDLKMWDVRTRLRALATETRNPGNVPFVDIVRPVEAA